jgi:hypothetical protein
MFGKIIASLSVSCVVLAAAQASASSDFSVQAFEQSMPSADELAYMGYQGLFADWGLPSGGDFCMDVNTTMLIAQDVAYAYLLQIGHVDSLLRPAEGGLVKQDQTQTQGQAQVKGKDIPASQSQTQGQAQVKGKDLPASQSQTQGQAQVKGKDLPASQSQTQGQAQVKGKDLPASQSQTQGQAQVKAKDIPVAQSQSQAQIKKGQFIPSQQSRSHSGVMLSDPNLRRFVDYTNALTDDEVRLVHENFNDEFLDALYAQMRSLCR